MDALWDKELPPMHPGSRMRAAVWFFVALVAIGCGSPATTVSGTVRLDGQPLPGAFLMFFPSAGDGPTSQAKTDDSGRYQATVAATKSTVAISCVLFSSQLRDGQPYAEETLPAKYADPGQSRLSVTPAAGKNTVVDFDLESIRKPSR